MEVGGDETTITQLGNVSTPTTQIALMNGASYYLGANSLAVNRLDLGLGGGTATLSRAVGGMLTANQVFMNYGGVLSAGAGDVINSLWMYGNSMISNAVGGVYTNGLTLVSSFDFTSGTIQLTFNPPPVNGYMWAFRWAGEHTNTLSGWLGTKLILINNAGGTGPAITYNADDSYTYIGMTAKAAGRGMLLVVQ